MLTESFGTKVVPIIFSITGCLPPLTAEIPENSGLTVDEKNNLFKHSRDSFYIYIYLALKLFNLKSFELKMYWTNKLK